MIYLVFNKNGVFVSIFCHWLIKKIGPDWNENFKNSYMLYTFEILAILERKIQQLCIILSIIFIQTKPKRLAIE